MSDIVIENRFMGFDSVTSVVSTEVESVKFFSMSEHFFGFRLDERPWRWEQQGMSDDASSSFSEAVDADADASDASAAALLFF